jgi:starch-binding outer membrane protein SusE/F
MKNISNLTAGHSKAWSLLWRILGLILLLTGVQSCKKELDVPKGTVAATPTVSSSASTIVLARADSLKTAVVFNWTAGKVNGLTGKLSYIIEVDKKGNNFANAIDFNAGDTIKKTFTVKALNSLLVSLPVNSANDLEMRLVTATSDGSAMPFFSNVISLNVTTYPPVPYSQLWLLGDATPGGWSLDNMVPMTESSSDPFIFTYTGPFTAGEFKIATARDYNATFYRPTTNHPDLSATAVQESAGDPDNKWLITTETAGTYKVTLNLHNNTISIVLQNTPKPAYSQLWLVGDATAGGWSLDSATPMVVSKGDPFIFTYTGAFAAGDFKIATEKDFNAPFYRPVINHPDLSATGVQLNAGDPDNKWQIAVPGTYRITLNLHNNTITIVNTKDILPPYTQLWMIGDATPGGWSLDNMSPMTVSPANAFVFTWTGALVPGEFKIATAKDFNAAFYRPYDNHPDLSVTDVEVVANPDNKWIITTATAGNYQITLNTFDNTISVLKQ